MEYQNGQPLLGRAPAGAHGPDLERISRREVTVPTGSRKGIQAAHAKKLAIILAMLDAASQPEDLTQPGLRLHQLKGDEAGTWSVWVNANWRVTFRFTGTDIELVDYRDYH